MNIYPVGKKVSKHVPGAMQPFVRLSTAIFVMF